MAGQYNQLVKFYNVEELCAEKLAEINEAFPNANKTPYSVATFYRFLIPNALPSTIDKCIYLDSDIIVNLDINELWRIELDDKPLAAADEIRVDSFVYPSNTGIGYLVTNGLVEYDDYFNSGVLLMNLNLLRVKEDLIMDGVKFVGEHPQLIYLDQEVLNYLFANNYIKLDEKFNFFVREARHRKETNSYRRIYHFAGAEFKMDMNDPFNRLWLKYFIKTPWFNEETIGRIYSGIQQMHVGLKNFAVQISAMMSGKTRAFFVLPQNVDATKKIFSIRDDEEIILAENQTSLQRLVDAMNSSRGKKVFFILAPGFPFQMLIQAGFVYGRDFLSGIEFLSEAHGVPLNSYEFVKAM